MAARQHAGTGRATRRAGNPPSRQPRPESAFRAADRFPRRRRARRAGRRGLAASRDRRHRPPERETPARRQHALLPVPPSARVEPAPVDVDGLRTQARQARRPQPRAAGRQSRARLQPDRGRPRRPAGHALRDHAGCRHPVAAGSRAPADRNHGASLEPAMVQQGFAARGRGLRPAATAHLGDLERRSPQPLRTPVQRLHRARPIHARGVGRVPGPVRRSLVRGQGHLRRRRVQPLGRHAFSERPDPFARPAGRLVRESGVGQRHRTGRTPAQPLQRGSTPPPPLDPRRLADRAMAVADRARPAPARLAQHPQGAPSLEDPRQPAARTGAAGDAGAVVARLVAWRIGRVLDAGRGGDAAGTAVADRVGAGGA